VDKALWMPVSPLHSTIRNTQEHIDAEEKLAIETSPMLAPLSMPRSPTQEYVDAEGTFAIETKSHVNTTVNAEITHLREQNVLLAHLLGLERTKGERVRDKLIGRVSGLLTKFTATRDRELEEGFGMRM